MPRPETLWCTTKHKGRVNGWSFPPAVERLLLKLTAGKRVCHLFGGLARFGTRIDIDPIVKPHVIADAWMPPFVKDAFDVVILDPPYERLGERLETQLLTGAAFIAREQVIWFHTCWIASRGHCRLEASWLVRVGDNHLVRCIQVFRTPAEKKPAYVHFMHGPATRYNRWLGGQQPLPGLRSND